MADYNEDPYAFIIDYCVYSTSQEDFLSCSNLVREDDEVTFCTVGYDSTLQSELSGVESADDVANEIDLGKLGLSPKLKEGDSPLVHCSGKFMIESEGDSMVKVVKPIRCVTADGVECSSDELGFGYGGDEGEILAENEVHKYEGEDEKGNENVEKSEENVDTEEIEAGNEGDNSAKNEDVLFVETEMIEVDEEKGTSGNEEISNVDTEVIGVDEEEGNNNSVKLDELSGIDTTMRDFDEVLGDVDSKVSGVVDEVENCGKIDGETRNVDMKVVGIDNEQDNCGKIDEERRGNVDTVEMVIEEEEVNCFEVGVEMDNTCKEEEIANVDSKVVGVDEEQGNCAEMDGNMRDVSIEEIANVDSGADGVDEEDGNCGTIDGNTSNLETVEIPVEEEDEGNGVEIDVDTHKDEEIANLDSKEVKVDVELRNCAELHEESTNVDTEEIVVEEEKKNCGDAGEEICNTTSSEEEIANVDSKVVGVDQDQGNCAKMDEKMIANVELREVGVDDEQGSRGTIDGNINNVDTVEFVVEEEEEVEEEGNCVVIGVEINNTHKDEKIANLDSKAARVDEELKNCVDIEEIVVKEQKKVVGVDQEQGNSAKFKEETSNVVDMEEVVIEDEERNCVGIDVEINNTNKDEEIANLDSKAVRVDEQLRSCAEIHEESISVDVEEIANDESNFSDVAIEMSNSTSREEEIAKVESKVVGVDQEQGNCAKFNKETSNVIDMEEVEVEEEERNCVEMNNTSKAHEIGMSKINKDNIEGSRKSNEDESREGTRKRKLPPSMFEQWGKRIKNTEWCSKDINLNVNETKKPFSKETAIRCILDAQKFLMGGKSYGSGGKVDFLETAKRRGMTFPKPRFRSD